MDSSVQGAYHVLKGKRMFTSHMKECFKLKEKSCVIITCYKMLMFYCYCFKCFFYEWILFSAGSARPLTLPQTIQGMTESRKDP